MGILIRILSICIALALVVSLLPNTALAADSNHWASDSVVKLNSLYGEGTFSEEYEAEVKVGELKHLLTQTFKSSNLNGFIGLDGANDSSLTRGVLVHTVVKLFNLGRIEGNGAEAIASAIAICKEKGIVSGYPDGTFGENDSVNNGTLAVVFYRAINKAAGSIKANQLGLVPGTYGYEELMYFSVRRIPFGNDVYNRPFDDHMEIDVGDTNITGAAIVWDKWGEMLNALTTIPDSIEYDFERLSDNPKTIDAVVEMVRQHREILSGHGLNTSIFSDVPPSSWFYEGIMYLYNQGIVVGTGDGNFAPYNPIRSAEMATLVLRARGVDAGTLPLPDIEEFISVFTHPDFISKRDSNGQPTELSWTSIAVWAARDYYAGQTDFAPNEMLTREGMAYAAVALFEGYDENNVNLSILDRFDDKDQIMEQYRKSLAYLVSIGVLKGSSPDVDGKIYLNPKGTCTRGEAGVFMARVLQGLDRSKMQDFRDAVNYVKNAGGTE